MSKKKIFIIYQYFGTKNSKWSTRWYDFSQELVANDYDVTVITSNFIRSDFKKVNFFKSFVVDNVKVKLFPFGDGNNLKLLHRVFNSLFFMIFSSIYLFFVRADKYVFSSGPITAAIPIIFKKKNKTILEVRDLWPDGGFVMNKIPSFLSKPLFLAQKIIYNSAGQIITCSPAQLSYIVSHYPTLIERISCVEHGIDPRILNYATKYNSLNSNNILKYWVVVATLGYIHNPGKWLELAKNLNKIDSNIKLVLIGSGPLQKEVSDNINKYNINNIILTGQLTKEELSKWIIKAEFCLFTTLENSVQLTSAPNKIYDYIAFKKPILIDLDMWHLNHYNEIIWKVDFVNFSKKHLASIRNKNSILDKKIFDFYIDKLSRKKLAIKYIK
mgnify:CR=1 FL=1